MAVCSPGWASLVKISSPPNPLLHAHPLLYSPLPPPHLSTRSSHLLALTLTAHPIPSHPISNDIPTPDPRRSFHSPRSLSKPFNYITSPSIFHSSWSARPVAHSSDKPRNFPHQSLTRELVWARQHQREAETNRNIGRNRSPRSFPTFSHPQLRSTRLSFQLSSSISDCAFQDRENVAVAIAVQLYFTSSHRDSTPTNRRCRTHSCVFTFLENLEIKLETKLRQVDTTSAVRLCGLRLRSKSRVHRRLQLALELLLTTDHSPFSRYRGHYSNGRTKSVPTIVTTIAPTVCFCTRSVPCFLHPDVYIPTRHIKQDVSTLKRLPNPATRLQI